MANISPQKVEGRGEQCKSQQVTDCHYWSTQLDYAGSMAGFSRIGTFNYYREGRRSYPFCSGWATLSHMMWKCPHIATNPHEHSTYFLNIHNDVQWETALHSSTAEDQQALVRIARKATDSHGVGRILAGKKTQDQSSYSGPINSCLSISLDAWMQSNAIRQASHGQACLFGFEKLIHEGTVAKKKQDGHNGCLSALSSFNSGHHSFIAILSGVAGQGVQVLGLYSVQLLLQYRSPRTKLCFPKDAGFESESRATINDSRTVYPVLCWMHSQRIHGRR